jgi:hypothetical protein
MKLAVHFNARLPGGRSADDVAQFDSGVNKPNFQV